MPLVVVSPSPVLQFLDANGKPLSGGLLFSYVGGTTTKVTTYSDATGLTPNTNPIVLDLLGSAPSAIFVVPNTNVKFVLAPKGDTDPPSAPIWTVDNVAAPTTAAGTMSLQNSNTVDITGGSVSVGTLVCTGATVLSTLETSGDIDCDANLNISGTLSVALTSTFSQGVTINANLNVNSGTLMLSAVTANAQILIQSFSAGFGSSLLLQTGASSRWAFYKNATAESGSNTGSDLEIDAYADSGAFNFHALTITRATGLVGIKSLLISTSGGLTFSGQSNGAGSSTGTLTNAPHAVNPSFWIPVTVNGTAGFIPFWTA